MATSKKVLFRQFDPVIYPRNLWVAVGSVSIETIKDQFEVSKGLSRDYEDTAHKCGGIAMKVVQLNTRFQGILMIIKKKSATVSTIAHESVHIADYIFEEIGAYSQDFNELNEQYAYLVGWAADCIDKALKNKFKP